MRAGAVSLVRTHPSSPLRMSSIATAIVILAALTLAACAGSPRAPGPSAGDCALIHVSSNGWHTRVHLPAAAFPADGPLRRAYPEADWLSIGWGDAGAYPNPLTFSRGAAALLWPTDSVLHVSGHMRDPRTAYRLDFQTVAVSQTGLTGLAAELERDLALDDAGEPFFVAPGLGGRSSRFYAAQPSYHVLRTCNVWMADRLAGAGLPTGWSAVHFFPGTLMGRLERRALPACP